jgi:serine O-acetyltransferase
MLLRVAVLFPGFSAVLLYRLAHLLHTRLPGPLAASAWVPTRISGILTGVNLSPAMHAGPGLMVNHTGNVFFGPLSIGSNCNVAHGVTVGQSSTGEDGKQDVPTIGDRVWIGPGAVIVGKVHLGDDCAVGANSLVARDVPPGGLAIGVPARVVSRQGSFRQVRYYGMQDDQARIAAMRALAVDDVPGPADGLARTTPDR